MARHPPVAAYGNFTPLHLNSTTSVNTTGQPAIGSAATLPMTPASMTNIALGDLLTIDTSSSLEVVQVLSIVTVNTNSGSSTVGSAGSATITPASMGGIIVGAYLSVDTSTNQEYITVTAVTPTTFTATFAKTHGAGFAIGPTTYFTAAFTKTHAASVAITNTKIIPVGRCVSTTGLSSITAGSAVVVTPASMANIVPQMWLNIANGTGTAEDVMVQSVTATTFTAAFQNNHSGPYTIIGRTGTFLGRIVTNQAGSGNAITLYNGHPSLLPQPTAPGFGVIGVMQPGSANPSLDYGFACDYGLFYSLTASGAVGDFSLGYLDMVPA